MRGGRSAIIDPWERIVLEGKDPAELLNAKIDMNIDETVRRDLPVLDDRRQDLYHRNN